MPNDRELWDRKASFWDALHGHAGNDFHRRLVEPSLLQLLELQAGERLLDVACGNGALARTLANLGAHVTAIDFSERMIDLARKRGAAQGEHIDYLVCDARDEAALRQLGSGTFDAVVCAMALMDMEDIAPLFRAAACLLSDRGRFVFCTMHPSFNSNNPIFIHEKEDIDGTVREHHALKIRHYLRMPPVLGSGAPDEPSAHHYYHRPLSELLGAAFAAGFALDGLLEPAYSADDATNSSELSWARFPQIPPVLTCRLRLV